MCIRDSIEALSAKADKLEDTNRMLKATIGNLPGIGAVIANNEKRIQAIREEKIPERQQKIDQAWKKIDKFTAKRDRIEHKLNRVIALNDTIKSFSIDVYKRQLTYRGKQSALSWALLWSFREYLPNLNRLS